MMSKRIEITTDTRLRVLTFRGLESEYYQGIPEAWVECFGAKNKEDPNSLTFDRILYLRNVNIQPDVKEALALFLPIWHAAVITFRGEAPVTVLLISESALMDKLVVEFHPMKVLRDLFPRANLTQIRTDMIDAEEEGLNNGAKCQFPSIVLEGWPSEDWRKDYLKMKDHIKHVSEMTGKDGQIEFTYNLSTRDISMQLHFVYLILDVPNKEFLWIQHDEMCPLLEIDPGI